MKKTTYVSSPIKFFALLTWCFAPGIAYTQSCNLFFSEYIEGTSNNKAIEVYNPLPYTVNLSDYIIYRANNGSPVFQDSLFMQGTLASGAVYVAGNPSAIASILNVSDTLHTITFFNGDDVMALYQRSTHTTLDIIGQLGVDPGTNWPVGAGATSEFTLIRNSSVKQGTTNWTQSTTEWDIYPANTDIYLGSHNGSSCCTNTNASMSYTVCNNYTSPSGNYTWTISGTYKDTISNAEGCDSILTLNLTINHNTVSTHTVSICESYLWLGTTYTISGTYRDTLTNAMGCDSILTLNLTINYNTVSTHTASVCENYLWLGTTYTVSGTYMDTLTNAVGCDSILTLDLIIKYNTAATYTMTACNSFTWSGMTFTASVTYMDTVANAAGCDSVTTLILTINTINTGITQNSNVLSANANGAAYRWLDCGNNYAVISGAIAQSFTVMINGNYAVEITENSCVDTSDCKTVNPLGIVSENASEKETVYPNPFSDFTTLSLGSAITLINTQLHIYDILGNEVMSITDIHSRDIKIKRESLANGIYFYKLFNDRKPVNTGKLIIE